MINEYLDDCKERNVKYEKPYKGTFNVRISPELHRNIAEYAIEHGKSLNAAVEEAIGNMVGCSLILFSIFLSVIFSKLPVPFGISLM